ncbi:hypothetical protein GQ43DRAFT_149687 [Delitschia confertaspora ATCC 74209]|uniref:Calcineurin-like phosphoesterase domain-containing protein n=1 Tax=Delitschia confertaspora ATCC 74209 TaxID=1513339 RepID=A0A9P4MPV3_9PLEO|nr:hypothetical protein GQ43DRAFT_149687 [Delitschia confertaspora ATCC 74209]
MVTKKSRPCRIDKMNHKFAKMQLLNRTRILCISDTHNQTSKFPRGDVLSHTGDLTNRRSYFELKKTVE